MNLTDIKDLMMAHIADRNIEGARELLANQYSIDIANVLSDLKDAEVSTF